MFDVSSPDNAGKEENAGFRIWISAGLELGLTDLGDWEEVEEEERGGRRRRLPGIMQNLEVDGIGYVVSWLVAQLDCFSASSVRFPVRRFVQSD